MMMSTRWFLSNTLGKIQMLFLDLHEQIYSTHGELLRTAYIEGVGTKPLSLQLFYTAF